MLVCAVESKETKLVFFSVFNDTNCPCSMLYFSRCPPFVLRFGTSFGNFSKLYGLEYACVAPFPHHPNSYPLINLVRSLFHLNSFERKKFQSKNSQYQFGMYVPSMLITVMTHSKQMWKLNRSVLDHCEYQSDPRRTSGDSNNNKDAVSCECDDRKQTRYA